METGIYDISNEDYHGGVGISRSGIREILAAPIYYKSKYLDKVSEAPTQAMILGSALHTKVLEPHLFDQQYCILPECDKRTKDGKAIYAEALVMAKGKQILKGDELNLINILAESINSSEDAKGLLANTQHEKSLYWTDEETGVLCKARPDFMFLSDDISYVGDIKTTNNASPRNFQKDMYDYGYHIQAATIAEGLKQIKGIIVEDFYYVVVEKSEPYLTAIYKINAEALAHGHDEFKKGLRILKECQEKGIWPGYEIQEIGLPAWAYYN